MMSHFAFALQLNKLLRPPILNISYRSTNFSNDSFRIPPPVPLSYNVINGSSNRPPVIILHGLFGNKTNWKTLSKSISESTNRTVYAVDLRNHGDSPHTSADATTMVANASDIRELIAKEDIKMCSLLGHSMGARVISQFCFLFPDLLEKIVLVDMTPLPTKGIRSVRRKEVLSFINAMRNSLVLPEPIDPSLPLFKARKVVDERIAPVVLEKFVRDFILLNLVKDDKGGPIRWKFNLDSCEKMVTYRHELINVDRNDSFNKEALMIYGSLSEFFDPNEKPAIDKMYPLATYHCVQGAGHYLHIEKQEEFLKVVTSFLNQIEV